MPAIQVPAGVPCPQTSTVVPEEGRLLSEPDRAPRAARTVELDERQFQTFTWMMSAEQAATFRDWWRNELYEGGAWFSAPDTWPQPEGFMVKVRRFIGAPAWSYAGMGFWRVAVDCEVRGRTLLPNTPVVSSGGIAWHEPVQDSGGAESASPENEGVLTEQSNGGNALYGGIYPWADAGPEMEFTVAIWEPVIPGDPPPIISDGGAYGTFQISPGLVRDEDNFIIRVSFGVAQITASIVDGPDIPNRLQISYSSIEGNELWYADIEYLWFAS